MLNDVWILIVIFIILGITKDVLMLAYWLENWIRSKSNGGGKVPPTKEKLQEMLDRTSALAIEEIKLSFDQHFSAGLAESKKTNELLFKFLLVQKIMAKSAGIDLPEGI